MTWKQQEILNFIDTYYQENGMYPTITEIAEALYTSRSWVRECIYRLCDKGYLFYNDKKRRSIVLNKSAIVL